MIAIQDIAEQHVDSFHRAFDAVAREKKYLARTEAPRIESTRAFVLGNIASGVPQVVALDGDRVIGWCDISPHQKPTMRHCGTLGMGVIAQYRHMGAGTRLIHAALRKAGHSGMERVELEVFASNEHAIRLYEKVGFTREGRRVRAVKIDGEYLDCLLMALFVADRSSPEMADDRGGPPVRPRGA